MPRKGLVRIGGVAGAAAGTAYYAAGVADLLLAPEAARWPGPVVLDSSSDHLVQVLLGAGLAGTLVAVAGLLLRTWRRGGRGRGRRWALAVGSSAAFLGHGLLLSGALATLARGTVAGPGPLAWGYPAALVGAVVMGTALLDGRVLPRWCGLLLVFGYLLVALPGGSWAGEWMMLGSAWAAVGYALLSGWGVLRVPRDARGRVRTGRGDVASARPVPAHPRGGVGSRPRRVSRA